MNRRAFLAAGISLIGATSVNAEVLVATPGNLGDEPWLGGSTASYDLPADAVAEAGTVQVVKVSPVLYPEFAVILIHNATDEAVMIESVSGILKAPGLPGFEQSLYAYGIPTPILPPGEY